MASACFRHRFAIQLGRPSRFLMSGRIPRWKTRLANNISHLFANFVISLLLLHLSPQLLTLKLLLTRDLIAN